MICRRFLNLPNGHSNKIEDWDLEQQILDPINKFKEYNQKLNNSRLEGYHDFLNRKEDLEMNMKCTF